jgi:hypothetical protein
MPPLFHSTSVTMKDGLRDRRRVFGWALPASVVVHLVAGVLLIFGLPVSQPKPQQEEAIKVDLVPPPKPSQKAGPKPPAVKSAPEKPRKAKAEKPPPPKDHKGGQQLVPVLKPVFQFGEKDAGPRRSADGNSAKDSSASPTVPPNPNSQDDQARHVLAAVQAPDRAPPSGAPKVPAPKPAHGAKLQAGQKLREAKTLFSPTASGDPLATTAMRGQQRGERAATLCATELREQLRHTWPPFFPEFLPRISLDGGTVVEVPRAAFRAERQWYDLSYRCELDAGATKVVSFSFHVGDPVPRSEWLSRGLPSQ